MWPCFARVVVAARYVTASGSMPTATMPPKIALLASGLLALPAAINAALQSGRSGARPSAGAAWKMASALECHPRLEELQSSLVSVGSPSLKGGAVSERTWATAGSTDGAWSSFLVRLQHHSSVIGLSRILFHLDAEN